LTRAAMETKTLRRRARARSARTAPRATARFVDRATAQALRRRARLGRMAPKSAAQTLARLSRRGVATAASATYDAVEPPLTPVQRVQRAAKFWGATVPILVTYAFAESWLKSAPYKEAEIDLIWDRLHQWGSARLQKTMNELKGFYVKTGQLISTRVDLFPRAYIDRLCELQDRLDPLPAEVVKAVISNELLDGKPIDSVFSDFQDVPLGSASVAQVHKATLRETGKVVAIKVMRPYIEPKLRGDVKNIIKFAKAFEDLLPLDYYLVFTEIAERMEDELDFRQEAKAMDSINDLLALKPDGTKRYKPWLHTPRSVPGMVTKRVLVMDFLEGKTLTQIGEEAKESGDTSEALAKLIGEKLIKALTKGFGQMVLQGGLFHGDPHPGNIMVLNNGDIALLDFGQTKQLTPRLQNQLSELCVLLEEDIRDFGSIAQVVADMGVKLTPEADREALSACAVWMFDSLSEMPGDYTPDEFSENSPVRSIASFPQDLVMVGRAAVLIRGICSFFSIPWSVSRAWAPLARYKLYDHPLEESNASQWAENFVGKFKILCALVLGALQRLWAGLVGRRLAPQ